MGIEDETRAFVQPYRALFDGEPDVSVDQGWWPAVANALDALLALGEEYPKAKLRVFQVKQKLGELRIQCELDCVPPVMRLRLDAILHSAASACSVTCERCGRPGKQMCSSFGWLRVLCDEHAASQRERDARLDSEE
ncbi:MULTISPECIES: hypothetical protein [Ramlibacter]|uniref:Uncharacterized protein n=1 Tax=Ramlibacter pinisoli TaxID=2682844 RepID=A0A6N8IMI6_9BURK|nr:MULTISPECIES: hypothetical protein [Ramlibacter]MBA2960513.1 hypothetical protein [Ramlibacter sp. CGMCC 1.13660]MVQ27845.1 hypothetical protein [Ramlibacter pinisoli]